MLVLEKVEMVRHYDHMLRSMSWSLKLPAVVRLVSYVRRHRIRIAFSRRNVFLRDKHQCQYCSKKMSAHELTCDHVIPRSKGGNTSWDNLVAACPPCNRKKRDRTPEQAKMKLLTSPARPEVLPPFYNRMEKERAPEPWRDFLSYRAA